MTVRMAECPTAATMVTDGGDENGIDCLIALLSNR